MCRFRLTLAVTALLVLTTLLGTRLRNHGFVFLVVFVVDLGTVPRRTEHVSRACNTAEKVTAWALSQVLIALSWSLTCVVIGLVAGRFAESWLLGREREEVEELEAGAMDLRLSSGELAMMTKRLAIDGRARGSLWARM